MTTPSVAPTDAREKAGSPVPMKVGPTEDLVRQLSTGRGEPDWMLRQRLRGLDLVRSDGVPAWAAFLREFNFGAIVPSDGSPAREGPSHDSTALPGLGALEASEEAYRAVRADLESRGIRFYGLSTALARIPDSLRTYLASVIPPDDDPIAALNAALWTEGSFLYVPPGVSVGIPLQAEIRDDYSKVEAFERNVIVADLSAIEVVAMPGSHVRYIALQNFSKEVDNLVTKRAQVHGGATLEWIDVNLGSRRTWKVPRANLVGPGAAAEFVGVAFAGKGQHQDVGAEMVHLAPRTHSRIVNHGIVQKGGRATLRSGIRVAAGATEVTSSVTWSSLMLDAESRAQTSPSIEVDEADAEIVQEGTVRKVGEEMLFYMSSRGVPADEATRMVVLGIASEATRRIPVEYAVEVDRLLELELEGGIG